MKMEEVFQAPEHWPTIIDITSFDTWSTEIFRLAPCLVRGLPALRNYFCSFTAFSLLFTPPQVIYSLALNNSGLPLSFQKSRPTLF